MVPKGGRPWRSTMMQEEASELVLSSSEASCPVGLTFRTSDPLTPQYCVLALTCENSES
jgi:hypothetical protein